MVNVFAQIHFRPLADESESAELISLIAADPVFAPVRYGSSEPLDNLFSSNAAATWSRWLMSDKNGYWSGSKDDTGGAIHVCHGQGMPSAAVSLWSNMQTSTEATSAMNLLLRIAGRFGAIYGYVHFLTPSEICVLAPTDVLVQSGPSSYMLSVTRWKLVRCIPELFFFNLFGPAYVECFGGVQRVLDICAGKAQALANGVVALQLANGACDFVENAEAVAELRAKTKRALGPDFFFDKDAKFDKTYKVPQLQWKEPMRRPILPVGNGPLKVMQPSAEKAHT
jgi:hypothetical protein